MLDGVVADQRAGPRWYLDPSSFSVNRRLNHTAYLELASFILAHGRRATLLVQPPHTPPNAFLHSMMHRSTSRKHLSSSAMASHVIRAMQVEHPVLLLHCQSSPTAQLRARHTLLPTTTRKTRYLLLATYYLVATCCLPLATCYLLIAACYLLLATCCLLRAACCLLLAACCLLLAACHFLLAPCCLLLSTCSLLLAAFY